MGVALLSFMVGTDLSGYPVDGPLPEVGDTNLEKTRQNVVVELARRENLSIRQLYRKLVALRAHFTVVGTPTDIADTIEAWFTAGAADGFNIAPALMPSGLEEFVDQVVPELQKRGIFRTQYEGKTLRENLGLERPVSRYAKQDEPA
jgi:alkanesulfonate monooxygenase